MNDSAGPHERDINQENIVRLMAFIDQHLQCRGEAVDVPPVNSMEGTTNANPEKFSKYSRPFDSFIEEEWTCRRCAQRITVAFEREYLRRQWEDLGRQGVRYYNPPDWKKS